MIRIRNIVKKQVTELNKNNFVEICNGCGELLSVIYINDDSEIIVIKNNTPESYRYSKITGQKFSDNKLVIIKK